MTDSLPSLTITGHVATLCLNRPTFANRLTPADVALIRTHIDSLNANPEVRVLLLKAVGKYFCSGYEIAQVVKKSQNQGESFGEMVDALEQARPVTVALLQGGVYGGATDMALACDFRMGTEACEMLMPAAKLGLHFYASGLARFVSRLGPDTTRRLFLSAEKLDASAMLSTGYLSHLVDSQNLETKAAELVDTLLTMAPLALLGMKQSINELSSCIAHNSIQARVVQTVASQDLAEGILAWQEKRAPVFVGR